MNRIHQMYKTNLGGYYWYSFDPESGYMGCGFEEYTRRCGDVWSTNEGDVNKGLDKIKRIVPDFYTSICEMLERYGKNIKDYETGVSE